MLFQITQCSKAQHKCMHSVVCDADSQLSSRMSTKEGLVLTGNFFHLIFWIFSFHALNFVTYPPHVTAVEMASQEGEIICLKSHRETETCGCQRTIRICELGNKATILYREE